MNLIEEILLTFSEKDYKEFRSFMVRHKPSEGRKDFLLLDDLWKSVTHQESLEKDRGKATYHANRKRIQRALIDFITLKQIEQDPSQTGSLISLITVSLFLFDYKRVEAAWRFLLKAEDMAMKNNRPGVLLQIYRIMADHLHEQDNYSFNQLTKLIEKARKKQEQMENIQLATAKIRMELLAIMQTGKKSNFEQYVKNTLDEFG
jgi:hypothetical protein